jgi:prevent-host-death family protein
MQLITVRELRLRPAEVWKRLKEEHELVVTSKGRPVGVLTDAGIDIEETLAAIRQARAQVAVTQMREQAAKRGLSQLSMAEIDKHIQTTRRARKK